MADKKSKLFEDLLKNPAGADAKASELKGFGIADPSAFKSAKEILEDPDGADRSPQFAKLPYPIKLVLLDALAAEGAANFLARLQRDEKDKGVGKAIAKAIHGIRAQGLKVNDLREKKSVAFDFASEGVPDSYVSPIDPEGNRLVVLARVSAMGKLNVFHAACGDTEGLTNFEGMGMSRAQYRQFLRMAEAQMQVALAKVPGDWAAWLVSEAARVSTKNGLPKPASYESAVQMIEPPAAKPADPLLSVLDEKEVASKSKDLVKGSDALHKWPECAFWVPDEASLEKLVEKDKEAKESKVAINDEQRKELRLKGARDLAKGYWSDEKRKIWADRLRATAHLVATNGRTDDGKLAWATAMELEKGSDVEKVPFAVELFEKIVRHGIPDPHAGHDHGPGEHDHGGIGDQMRAAAATPDAPPESGVIVKP